MRQVIRAMINSLGIGMFLSALLLWAPLDARAQYGNFQTAPNLTGKDVKILRKLVREDFTGKPNGTMLPWSNPVSKNSGTVTLLSSFQSQGRDCRRVRYFIKPGGAQSDWAQNATYTLTSCHLPDGSWRLDNQAQPDKTG
jgi:17 kDa outer membrane surface antigen